jgi:hypothetical protein
MKTASSGNFVSTSNLRLAIASLAIVLLAGAATPALPAETPADQIKAAGAIPLTSDLLDKMDKTIKGLTGDEAAKAELGTIGKDPNMTPESWATAVSSKCPKATEHFKSSGITPDEFAKGIFAIMACAMSEDMAKSSDKDAAANAAFVTANKDKCDAVFSGFMMLSMPAEPSSSPAATP